MKKLKVVETFSGIGSQAKALERLKKSNILDFEIVNTADWDVTAILAYCMIHKDGIDVSKYNVSDDQIFDELSRLTLSSDGKKPMTERSLKMFSNEARREIYTAIKETNNLVSVTDISGEDIGDDTDILTYSFPCQDLSICGSWHGNFSGISRDAHNRSGMLWEIERILLEMKSSGRRLPNFLVMENVTNILSPKHRDDFEDWQNTLENLGYFNKVYRLSAEKFGVPQHRPRAYMISVLCPNKRDVVENYFLQHDLEKQEAKPFRITVQDILKTDMTIDKYFVEAALSTPNDTPSRREIYQENPVLFSYKNGFDFAIINTITTKQDRNPNSGVIDFKNELKGKSQFRYLTPRECFMLMGFDEEDFERVVSNPFIRNRRKSRRYYSSELLVKLAGNSIVVDVLEAIFTQISEIDQLINQ